MAPTGRVSRTKSAARSTKSSGTVAIRVDWKTTFPASPCWRGTCGRRARTRKVLITRRSARHDAAALMSKPLFRRRSYLPFYLEFIASRIVQAAIEATLLTPVAGATQDLKSGREIILDEPRMDCPAHAAHLLAMPLAVPVDVIDSQLFGRAAASARFTVVLEDRFVPASTDTPYVENPPLLGPSS